MKQVKKRIDVLLVEKGLAESREKAKRMLMAGQVRIGTEVISKPGAVVAEDARLAVERGLPYVSRGGLKLERALEAFKIEVRGKTALDVGASTGGFTDCLLQRGAAKVYAVDVGTDQLHYKLRQDRRVVCMEGVNAHYDFALPEAVGIVTADVSFISLTKVLPQALKHLTPGGTLVCLVKPQFEAGREQVGRGGVVKDPRTHGEVLSSFLVWAIGQRLSFRGLTPSPIEGDKGNREFLAAFERPLGG
ncbi:MAG: TlyA family RNA methyltransferase [Chloroflexi bacterium]|nr:TlyA family RNA methyltransferase [Chloroflexota bacterium]